MIKRVTSKELSMKQLDLIIIGGGSAAFSAAIRANEMKLDTLLVNDGLPLGGTCVNVGCVPSKFLIRAAESIHRASHSPFDGITPMGVDVEFRKIIQQKNKLVADMQQRKYLDLLKELEFVQVLEGFAEFEDANIIRVHGEKYRAIKIIIATGSSVSVPAIDGLENVPYFTNSTFFDLEEQPESVVIIGGGYIGLEIAQAYNRFGTKVTIVEMQNWLLPAEAKDISDELTKQFRKEGIEIRTGASVKRVAPGDRGVTVTLENEVINATHLLVATGRKANIEKLLLNKAGVEIQNGFIKVNDRLETNIPNIYAVGDVNAFPQFVYTAAHEGGIAVANAFAGAQHTVDYSSLPWVVFTDPQVAGVGMDEREATAKGIAFETAILPLTEIPKSIAALDTRGFIKLIKDPESDLLLGARIVATEGSELTMELSLAIKYKIPVKELVSTLHPYLTLAEGVKLAAMSYTTDLKRMSCCAS